MGDHTGGTGEATTLASYLDGWLERHRMRVRDTTAYYYEGVIRRELRPAVGHLTFGELTPAVVTRVFTDMALTGGPTGQPVSLRVVRGAFALLRQVIGDAVHDGLLADDPCRMAIIPRRHPDPPPRSRREPTVWTAEQLVAFLAATADRPLAELWVVAACTGMRRGELLGLSWDDIDVPRRTIRVDWSLTVLHADVERTSTKNVRPRNLTFGKRVFAALARQHRQQQQWQTEHGESWHNIWNLVFTRPDGRPLLPNSVSRTFGREVARAGLPHATVHTLRHLHATLMLQAGTPVNVVSERLGHATARMTLDMYTHVLPAMDSAAVELLATLLQRAGRHDAER